MLHTKTEIYRLKTIIPLSILYGFAYVLGDIFVYNPKNSFNFLTLINAFFLSGIFFLFFIVFIKAITSPKLQKQISIIIFLKKHIFRNTFFLLIFFWIGHLIIKYPAGQCPDSYTQIQMGLHPEILSTHHPLVSTLLMTRFVQFGEFIGNRNVGIFLYVTVEALLLAAVFSYVISVLYKNFSIQDPFLLISILFFAFSPYIVGYIGQPIKDVMYTTGFVLLITTMIDYKTNPDKKAISLINPWMIIKLLISAGLLYFFRKEGIIVLVICFFLFFLWDLFENKNITITFPILLIILLIPIFISYSCEQKYNPQKGSIREMLSMPFQQTARYITKHRDIISSEEIEAISRVLDITDIPNRYITWSSDQIKELYNEKATLKDLADYFWAWLTGFRKAPLCYLRATIEQNIYLIYPGYNNYEYYIDANSGAAYLFGDSRLFSTPDFILSMQSEYLSFLEDMHTFPFLNIINNMSFYIWMLLVCTIISVHNHDNLFLQISIPLYITVVIIILAPCIRGSVRYAYPIIWSFPLWFCCMINSITKKRTKQIHYQESD